MADTWFTSDFHLGHFNIIRYCNRPFADTQEMNEVIVERMNASVKPNDVLYFLGDFCWEDQKQLPSIAIRLPARRSTSSMEITTIRLEKYSTCSPLGVLSPKFGWVSKGSFSATMP
jgi:hypothetical protein